MFTQHHFGLSFTPDMTEEIKEPGVLEELNETAIYDYSSGESAGFSPPKKIKKESSEENSSRDPILTSTPMKTIIPLDPNFTDSENDEGVMIIRPPDVQGSLVVPDSSDDDPLHVLHLSEKAITISSSESDSIPDIMHMDNAPIKPEKEFHNTIPIFSKPNTSLHAKEIFKLCFGEVDDAFICKKKPTSVRYNAVFVIDLNEVDQRSIYADDNGVWKTASPRSYYKVDIRDGNIENVVPGNKDAYTHYLKRQYGTHQATYNQRGLSFQRIISTATSKYDIQSRYCVVQYIHRDSDESDIVMKAHGNIKGPATRPFLKTDPCVLESIKQESQETKPRRLFKRLIDDAGGSLYSSSASSEPRNLQQIYNVRSATKVSSKTDDMALLWTQIKDSTFVREFAADSNSLQYILVSQKQLIDLERFCTHPVRFSVFSIDSTFNVGNYYITNTCFENLRVVHASGKYKGKHPLEMGPTFVHTNLDTSSYVRFLSALQRMNPNLKNVQAVGTDGDEAIMNSVVICFQDAQSLLCALHKKSNIEQKLKEFRAPSAASGHIISDIFGTTVGSTMYQKGLIDSLTVEEFDRRLRDLKPTWDCLVNKFHSWFVEHESRLFKCHLIKEVTDQANVDGHFSNNRVESVNNNVKDWVGRSGDVSLPEVNNKIEEYIRAQQQEFEMSIYANGPYDLANTHVYLRKERHEWNGFNVEERKNVVDTFWKSAVEGRGITGEQSRNQAAGMCKTKILSGVEDGEKTTDIVRSTLSISFEDANMNIPVPDELLKDLFLKAERIMQSPGSVIRAPGFEGLYVQHSTKEENVQPHLVTTVKSTGKIKCNNCTVFSSLKICPHALAAAETIGLLQKFIEWHKKEKHDINIAELMMGDLKSGMKRKVAKPRKGGRTPINKTKPTTVVERQPVVEGDIADTLTALDKMDQAAPFEILYLFQTKAISCYGCSSKFQRDKEQNTLVVRHFCDREYMFHGVKKTRSQYAYFHLKTTCITKKFPDYIKTQLMVAEETKIIIPEEVKDKLKTIGVKF